MFTFVEWNVLFPTEKIILQINTMYLFTWGIDYMILMHFVSFLRRQKCQILCILLCMVFFSDVLFLSCRKLCFSRKLC